MRCPSLAGVTRDLQSVSPEPQTVRLLALLVLYPRVSVAGRK